MILMCHLNSLISYGGLLILFAFPNLSNAAVNCDDQNDYSYRRQVYIYPFGVVYSVIGRGRLFFYSAPDERCIQKNIFIIPGDQVNAYTEYSDFMSVMYIDSHGKDTEGWVKRDRLQEVKPRDE